MSRRKVRHRRLKKYSIGEMNKRILLHVRSIESPDFDSANFEEGYDSGLPAWCSIETINLNGKTIFDDVDIKNRPTHIFVIRYRSTITSENVVRWQKDLYRIIETRDPEERHQYLELYSKILGKEDLEANK